MARLVDYSSSEEGSPGYSTGKTPPTSDNLKRKRSTTAAKTEELPPLPTTFYDLYASNTRVSTQDDPALHGGRKRHIPHVEGNWPTHVYLEWHPTPTEYGSLKKIVHAFTGPRRIINNRIHSLLESDLSTPLPLHISLSRPLVLRTEQREPFFDMLVDKIWTSSVHLFNVSFNAVGWFPNHDKTRWFLSLSAGRTSNDELNRLLHACNQTAVSMKQPTLYLTEETVASATMGIPLNKETGGKGPATPVSKPTPDIPDCSKFFHVSLAWSLEDPSSLPHDMSEQATRRGTQSDVEQLSAKFECVKVKIGNVVNTALLKHSKAPHGLGGKRYYSESLS